MTRRLARSIGLLILLPLCGCKKGVLDPQGPIAASERIILIDTTAIMLAVVIPVIILTLAFAWWFRAGNHRAEHLPNWSYSGRIEVVVWSIPALVVLFLGGIGWLGAHQLDPKQPVASSVQPFEVDVVALDWKWLFLYPKQNIASVNELVIPAGTPIQFRLTSASVMNSFFVPQLGSQIYAMSGMTTHLNLQADKPGSYTGLSAQFSGDGFSDMHFNVIAKTPADFAGWVDTTRAADKPLDTARYGQLARQSKADKPAGFSAVAPGLFDAIVKGDAPAVGIPHSGYAPANISPRSGD